MNKKVVIGFILSDKTYPKLLDDIKNSNLNKVTNIDDEDMDDYDMDDEDDDIDIESQSLCKFLPRKIIGFNTISFPDFTQESIDYKDIKNLSETELKDLGIDMFYNIKEAYTMPTKYTSHINDKYMEHDMNLYLVLYDKTNTFKLSEVPANIGSYQDTNKNPIWFSLYTDEMLYSHDIRNPNNYENKTQIIKITSYAPNLEINIIPNIGAYIVTSNNNPIVLWSNIDPKIYDIYDKRYGKPMYEEFHSDIKIPIKLPFRLRPIMTDIIKMTDDFITVDDTVVLRLDSPNKDELIIPECDTFIAFGTTLRYYKKVYFPKNIKSIITKVNYEDRDKYKDTVLYFDKETLKSRCINLMLYDNIKDYYSKYAYDQSYIDIPDKFQNAVFLKDAVDALGDTHVKIEFI